MPPIPSSTASSSIFSIETDCSNFDEHNKYHDSDGQGEPSVKRWRVNSVLPSSERNYTIQDIGGGGVMDTSSDFYSMSGSSPVSNHHASRSYNSSITSPASLSPSLSTSSATSSFSAPSHAPTEQRKISNSRVNLPPLSAFSPPPVSPLRRCLARPPSTIPPSPLSSHKNFSQNTADLMESSSSSSSAKLPSKSNHFLHRMDEELARIREAPVNIVTNASKYIISLDMSIFRAEDIQIILESGRLIIEAEREVQIDETRSIIRTFVRKLSIPEDIATDVLATQMSQYGILTITTLKRK